MMRNPDLDKGIADDVVAEAQVEGDRRVPSMQHHRRKSVIVSNLLAESDETSPVPVALE